MTDDCSRMTPKSNDDIFNSWYFVNIYMNEWMTDCMHVSFMSEFLDDPKEWCHFQFLNPWRSCLYVWYIYMYANLLNPPFLTAFRMRTPSFKLVDSATCCTDTYIKDSSLSAPLHFDTSGQASISLLPRLVQALALNKHNTIGRNKRALYSVSIHWSAVEIWNNTHRKVIWKISDQKTSQS
jgi:hypothetical protein